MQAARMAFAVVVSVAALTAHFPAQAQDIQKLFVEGDIVRGNTPLGATGPICVLTSQFKRGENVVFRIRVRNLQGKPLDVQHQVDSGRACGWPQAAHPLWRPPAAPAHRLLLDRGLDDPDNYPTGSLGYSITATDMDGNTVSGSRCASSVPGQA